MGRRNRRDIFDRKKVGIYHCIQRVVRRTRLCGKDPLTGKSFDYRRTWIQDRLKELVRGFAFDILAYCVMENHLHVVLRNRPDILDNWSDRKIVENWKMFFPGDAKSREKMAKTTPGDLASTDAPFIKPENFETIKQRLGDISWFMRALAEPIAKTANAEDETTGHFWEGRFKSQIIADETALLACCVYVDLNPIRAGAATTPEHSLYTSLRARILNRLRKEGYTIFEPSDTDDQWLAPIELDERAEAFAGAMPSAGSQRPSDKGFLPMTLEGYLELVDWTGRQLRSDAKSGCIPATAEPIFKRLGLTDEPWCELVSRFGVIFKTVAGKPETLVREAERLRRRWLQSSNSPLRQCSPNIVPANETLATNSP